jgi:putative radical SAM enzyme (TIGR03279 family)
MVRVKSVAPHSLAAELEIRPGTELLAINGRALDDFLDWEFLSADDAFVLHVRTAAGDEVEYDIERPTDLPMGVELEPPRIRRCANRCDFCFVDGLPQGLRQNLYIRDDDYRLSFRYGNFATLTNLKPRDIGRILEYRLSPLYVSVHATDPVIRRRYLRNPRAPDVIPQLRRFAAGGIRFHTQIVLQPGINDGPVLVRSLEDLYALDQAVLSVSVVPVGLTSFSKHDLVREPSRDECRAAIEVVHRFAERAVAARGHRWVHGSDELYLVARTELPPASWYGDFEQVENGVGSVRYLQGRVSSYDGRWPALAGRRVAVVTGSAMGRLMPRVTQDLAHRTGARFEVIALDNSLFGPSVTTAGLLPGEAFQRALAHRTDLDLALLPAESLNDDHIFLDDLSAEALARALPFPIHFSHDFGDALAEPAGA